MKKWFITLLVCCCFCLLLLLGAYFYFEHFKQSKIQLTQATQEFTVASGTTMNQLIEQLHQEKMIQNPWLIKIWIKLDPSLANIKSGIYQLDSSMSVESVLHLLNSNQGKEPQHKIQLIEGKTLKEYLQQLDQLDPKNKVLTGLTEAQIAEKLGVKTSLEGWIAPETYFYTDRMNDLEILQKAYQSQVQKLNLIWNDRDPNLPYQNAYEMLIMASIIEKETGIASERNRVASVFINRLQKKMKLQTDPTIIYGLGDRYKGTIYRSQINDTTNLYNTYVIDGLPPTPISMPSMASLYAAAHPEQTEYLYFVATGTGGHIFSKTYKEHQKAVENYRKKQRSKEVQNKK